jgi:hypothetical protein
VLAWLVMLAPFDMGQHYSMLQRIASMLQKEIYSPGVSAS